MHHLSSDTVSLSGYILRDYQHKVGADRIYLVTRNNCFLLETPNVEKHNQLLIFVWLEVCVFGRVESRETDSDRFLVEKIVPIDQKFADDEDVPAVIHQLDNKTKEETWPAVLFNS